ncbi:hypothetical protein TSUD_240690 [Trifolium subterraneum]|uniref:Uncharacterized protein n=1 Tax=Trifolium subterraneum TaxID=3900 RepID=A0A2Z6PUZ2_TRISU|nr:hypothetical protein TSUD_240690 [Trifolium subterraneum]
MPDGWETISKNQDGNIWEMSQREEDILMQEFERRIAYSKFQIASFIKTHIFSRRRPIDGWKYMIEVVGPNAKRGKGSVSRVPSLSDPSTQPFKEEKTSTVAATLPRCGWREAAENLVCNVLHGVLVMVQTMEEVLKEVTI